MLLGAQFLPYRARGCCHLALLLPLLGVLACGHVANNLNASSVPLPLASDPNLVLVNKCCEKFEIHVNNSCQQVNETGKSTARTPIEKVNNLCCRGVTIGNATWSLAWSFNFIGFFLTCNMFPGVISCLICWSKKCCPADLCYPILFAENIYGSSHCFLLHIAS